MSPSVDLINIKSISPNGTGQIDVPGDLNLTGTSPNPVYRINGVPLATGGTPAGSNTQIQYNANGAFGASSVLSFDDASVRLNVGPQVSTTITYGPSPIAFISYADTQAAIESQARIGLGVANNANATGNYASIGFYGVNSGATPTYHLAAMITAKTLSRNASGINANLVFATRAGTADPLREVMRVSAGGSVALATGPLTIGTSAIPANTNLYIQGSNNTLVSNGDVIINCDSILGPTNLRLGTRGTASDKPDIAIPPEIAFMWVGRFRPFCIFATADPGASPKEAIRVMPETAYVGIGGVTNPAYPLDVAGDVNTTGQYRVNGTALIPAGTNGQILVADSASPPGWKWETPADTGIAHSVTVLVTSDDIRDLNATPKILIPAPGANRTVLAMQIAYEVHQGATPFTGGSNVQCVYQISGNAIFANLSSINLTTAGPSIFLQALAQNSSVTFSKNEAITLRCATAFTGASDTYLYAHILYRIIGGTP